MPITQKDLRIGLNHIVKNFHANLVRLQSMLPEQKDLRCEAVAGMMRDEALRARWQLHGLCWAAEIDSKLYKEIMTQMDRIDPMLESAKKGALQ